ncbi:MAG: cytochrome c oxidase accessory protein CcoG [Burkholderiaceae bacterium]
MSDPAARALPPGGGPDPKTTAAAESDDAATAVISLYQKHRKIYPRSVQGQFARWRWALVWFTQIVFYGLPWLQWNGRQALLFDLGARRFYIFGAVLYPQDFIFLTGLLVISALSLFLFTAVAGRLWCGYACPQTVYTEMFMWIERRIEGDRVARMRLDASPWNANKIRRKAAKQAVWIVLALFTGFTFVGYFTPIRTLWAEAFTLSFGPWEWFWVNFYAFATYGNAGFMREQVCMYMCPYARFQSAMFDRDTLIIGYDTERGEPRGSRRRKADPKPLGLGHCIDCNLCVQVCPTGIDIRKGLQYECIGCAACVDVCNDVMDKMEYPRGLIRYGTQNGIAQHYTRKEVVQHAFRPRVLIYGGILSIVAIGIVVGMALRSPFKVNVVRDRASLARIVDEGQIENVYRLQIMNAAERAQRYRVNVVGLPGIALAAPVDVKLEAAEAQWVTVAVRLPPEVARKEGPGAHPMAFDIELREDGTAAGAGRTLHEKSTFVVPR